MRVIHFANNFISTIPCRYFNKANCNKEGAIDVIVRALKKYIDDPAICEFGCEILFNLFPEDNSNQST